MRDRIHELKHEIKSIESMLETLSGPMHELAFEELQSLQLELKILDRGSQVIEIRQISGKNPTAFQH